MRSYSTVFKWAGSFIVIVVVASLAWWTSPNWFPQTRQWVSLVMAGPASNAEDEEGHSADSHAGHSHADPNALELSKQARLNIGLTNDKIRLVELESFNRTITVPAMVTVLPGKTKLKVVAPMSGVITDVYAVEGESIAEGSPLFKIQLIHEDLVQAQTNYLKTLGSLDVEEKEIARLEKLTATGALAEKELLLRQYEKHKLEAVLRAQHESLLLHGLSEVQVKDIVKSRKLKSEFVVYSPSIPNASGEIAFAGPQPKPFVFVGQEGKPQVAATRRFVISKVNVSRGDFIQAGGTLSVLADYSKLYIQGRAFEQDAAELVRAKKNGWKVTAVLEDNESNPQKINGLDIVYLDHEVEADSRAFHFYVDLPNEILSEKQDAKLPQFVTWKYKPGQRMQLLVPVEKWEKRIVLPADAVAKEGAEYFIFVENGERFNRRPVHVEYRDQLNVVIAADGSVFPGDRVATAGAHQMQIALKNKAGGGVDPHAGHNH